MGSPLGPTFANCFLSFHEEEWLDQCPLSFKPLYYRRYVDDTFLLFRDPLHIPKFQEYLNNKHKNIKFTVEHENEGKLPFLDVMLTRSDNTISTSIYRKPTFKGLGINFLSFFPDQFKYNAIKTLLYRCFHLCSNWQYIHMEFDFLTKYFQNNKFPLNILGDVVSDHLESGIHFLVSHICVKYSGWWEKKLGLSHRKGRQKLQPPYVIFLHS